MDSRLRYFKPHATRIERSFAEEVAAGLSSEPKSVSPKFLYDRRGSELFERICGLPEYYLTRTEASMLGGVGAELPGLLGATPRLVELGSGASVKTRALIEALGGAEGRLEYVPVDISEVLADSSEALLRDYGGLRITGIMDTYEGGLEFLRGRGGGPSLILFLGSSFGNFGPGEGEAFLEGIRSSMGDGDMLLIGLDLVKDRAVLERAYDDPQGVTAAFNLNLLSRINCELDADFDLSRFEHHSFYNEPMQRVEMHLRSTAEQSVVISRCNLEVRLARGELIHTEFSHKYRPGQVGRMLGEAGLRTVKSWTDPGGLYSLTLAGGG